MLTSFSEWKNRKIDELQVGNQDPTNFRKLGLAFGDATSVANPKYMSYLKPRIDGLWRMNMYKAEKDNPGSTADPGRMRQLQDQFIKDLSTVIIKVVKGDEAGGGRSVNMNRRDLNQRSRPSLTPNNQPAGPRLAQDTVQDSPANLSAQRMGQGSQLKGSWGAAA